jgi:hypothetical protein
MQREELAVGFAIHEAGDPIATVWREAGLMQQGVWARQVKGVALRGTRPRDLR